VLRHRESMREMIFRDSREISAANLSPARYKVPSDLFAERIRGMFEAAVSKHRRLLRVAGTGR